MITVSGAPQEGPTDLGAVCSSGCWCGRSGCFHLPRLQKAATLIKLQGQVGCQGAFSQSPSSLLVLDVWHVIWEDNAGPGSPWRVEG